MPFKPDVNYPVYGPGATAANVDLRRPYLPGTLSSIGLLQSMMNNNYHGLQTTGEKRWGNGFSIKGFYTFSKSIDGADIQNSSTSEAGQNQTNLRMERGRTANDRRHNFVASRVGWHLISISSLGVTVPSQEIDNCAKTGYIPNSQL